MDSTKAVNTTKDFHD